MKRILPIIIFFLFFLTVFFIPQKAEATHEPGHVDTAPVVAEGSWVKDSEVTFVGKNAARSGNLLDFIIKNYSWVCVKQNATGQCDNSGNPLASVWFTTVTFIVVPLLFVVILVTAAVIIITRGRSLTVMRFIPRFLMVILLIFFSFSLIQFFYQFFDIIQGFFLRSGPNSCPPECISQKDLLFVGWEYEKFEGLRLVGDKYAESAFMSLLLTKLTALTYFVMVATLILRKIILWLFIIISPIFPLLLLYNPIRNTGKIWIGEFFRWLLYAPLFAIFLNGLVALWRNQIPLSFTPLTPGVEINKTIVYPTAINILLGGPKQFVTMTNSVNLPETFALYIVSLLMLWGVIILPWVLLQIFLSYASNLGVGDSAAVKKLVGMVNRPSVPPPASGGSAISLPFTKKFNMPPPAPSSTGLAREIPISASNLTSNTVQARVLSIAQVSVPKMTDIAKFETSLISKDNTFQKEAMSMNKNLQFIANPAAASDPAERQHYTEVREKLVKESNSGNTMATSILTAANTAIKRSSQVTNSQIKKILSQVAHPTANIPLVANREKLTKLNEALTTAKKGGNLLATELLSVNDQTADADIEKLKEKIRIAQERGEPLATEVADLTKKKDTLPVVNRVQKVSKEDFDAVKDMWKENYKNLEVPAGMAGTRDEWIKDDVNKIDEIVGLLKATDPEQQSKGMEEVSSILPFLLVGGFSQTEIVAYMKAKQEAGKDVLVELAKEEEEKVSVTVKKTEAQAHEMSASIPEEPSNDYSDLEESSSVPSKIFVPLLSVETLKVANLELPTLTDVVRYEVRALTKDKTESERVDKIHSALEKISNPEGPQYAPEKEKLKKLREKLEDENQKGNITAGTILSAQSVLTGVSKTIALPQVNRLQEVKQEDYEEIKKLWEKAYEQYFVPQGFTEDQKGRTEWINNDIQDIEKTINLLQSDNVDQHNEGVKKVSGILPFLLLGGFSSAEIINYLKAKQDAGRLALASIVEEEDSSVAIAAKKEEKQADMAVSQADESDKK